MKAHKFIMLFLLSIFSLSCQKSSVNKTKSVDKVNLYKTDGTIQTKIQQKHDSTMVFLWRENKYNKKLKGSYSTIVINKEYCKTISDIERAALAFVATWIGNDCWWENDIPNEDRTNLKCVILTALNLGCQGSKEHLKFLRHWFRNDTASIEALKDVPSTPYTSTIQDTFDSIRITSNENIITVWYKARGINTREQKSWSWSQKDFFKVNVDEIYLIKSERSKVIFNK